MHRKFDSYFEVKYWMEDVPVKMSNIRIFKKLLLSFFWNLHLSVFESLKKYFGLFSDRQIRTFHCSHNYLKINFNCKFELKSFN